MKGKQSTKSNSGDILDKEKIKKIMSRPVNPRSTTLYWMSMGRFRAVD